MHSTEFSASVEYGFFWLFESDAEGMETFANIQMMCSPENLWSVGQAGRLAKGVSDVQSKQADSIHWNINT